MVEVVEAEVGVEECIFDKEVLFDKAYSHSKSSLLDSYFHKYLT